VDAELSLIIKSGCCFTFIAQVILDDIPETFLTLVVDDVVYYVVTPRHVRHAADSYSQQQRHHAAQECRGYVFGSCLLFVLLSVG
jgi:hypothetical protein